MSRYVNALSYFLTYLILEIESEVDEREAGEGISQTNFLMQASENCKLGNKLM